MGLPKSAVYGTVSPESEYTPHIFVNILLFLAMRRSFFFAPESPSHLIWQNANEVEKEDHIQIVLNCLHFCLILVKVCQDDTFFFLIWL